MSNTTITQADGTVVYPLIITVGTRIDHLGKRREVQECHTLKTLKAAQDKQAEIKADRKRGQFAKRKALTFDQLCDRWLNSRHDVREVTVLGYRYALKVARELLGQVKVQELERTDIEKVIKTLQMRGAVASFSRLHARNDQTGVGVRDFIGAAVDQRGAV